VSRWNVVRVAGVASALFVSVAPVSAGADAIPVPPACISELPGLPVSCPPSAQPQAQSSNVESAQSAQPTRAFSVSATPTLARALVAEVNRTRRANGLRALTYSAQLTQAATEHAGALAAAGMFTHNWPTNGRLFGSWIRSFYPARGYRSWMTGENLLWASPGFAPSNAVQQWLDSPTHRRVLLTKSWRELGIGVVSAVAAPGAYGGRDAQIAAAEFGLRSR
jgi:uncharacterized protein YkwD